VVLVKLEGKADGSLDVVGAIEAGRLPSNAATPIVELVAERPCSTR